MENQQRKIVAPVRLISGIRIQRLPLHYKMRAHSELGSSPPLSVSMPFAIFPKKEVFCAGHLHYMHTKEGVNIFLI